MRHDEARAAFEAQLATAGLDPENLRIDAGLEAMLTFFESVRCEDCAPEEEDGDMLLYQWGPFMFGGLRRFHLDVTRQFIVQGEDGEPSLHQLSLTFFFEDDPAFAALGAGRTWCPTPHALPAFRTTLAGSAPYRALARRPDADVVLDFGPAD